MIQRCAEQNLLNAVGAFFYHATVGLGPGIETYQNKQWGESKRDRVIGGMNYLAKVLNNSYYVAGDDFSIADITVFAGIALADFAKIAIPAQCESLLKWRARIAARPSVSG